MAKAEERLKILELVHDGKITAEEGARLLQALKAGDKKYGAGSSARDPRWLHIRVTDTRSGNTKVNVNIPMSLVSVGLKMGARFAPANANFDYDEVMTAIKSGTTGKLLDVEGDDGERVEIWSE